MVAKKDIVPLSPILAIAESNPLVEKFITLLSDPSLSLNDVDIAMAEITPWPKGNAKEKLLKYPILTKTATEARILALKKVGLSRLDAYQAIKDGLGAVKKTYNKAGEVLDEDEDHRIRLEASRMLIDLIGDSVKPSVNIQNNFNGISADAVMEEFRRVS